ncbi:PolC-type DNA polymerase III [Butyrivibrio sp. WCD3002]|uniref:PolC-type DNA polymerase III n=1 Tax=Butyrivibrio sp. WCD3002 TaxID=1280676 RepID=UPI0004192703|nr:PolC-type DNA polymerase III [Butyrivibrio sp. WCD3002]
MRKPFLEVFATLELDKNTKEELADVQVEKISTTQKKDLVRIYLSSNRLIDKAKVIKAEKEIKKQLFKETNLTVKIYERFFLSAQYTPKNLLEMYKDSIMLEFKNYDPIEYTVLKTADFEFPESDKVVLVLEESVIAEKKAADIQRILEKILNERCGFAVRMDVRYKEAEAKKKEHDYTKETMKLVQKLELSEEKSDKKHEKEAKEKAAESKPKEQKPAEKSKFQGGDATASKGSKFGAGSSGKFFKKNQGGSFKRSDDPNVIYGRDFEDEAMPMEEIVGEMGEVTVRGQVISYDKREIKGEKAILMFAITDYTDTITAKLFAKMENVPELEQDIKKGAFLKIKGIAMVDKFDHEVTIQSIAGIRKVPDFTTKRVDEEEVKRVELHCHTKMSDMDGVSEVKDIIKQAYKWGMPGIAITDHGVVQALTDANHAWEDLWKAESGKRKEAGEKRPDRQDFFKVVQGVEGYLVDDLKEIVINNKGQKIEGSTFVVFDIETTGFSPKKNKIIEIGAVKLKDGQILDRFSEFIDPGEPIPFNITKLTSITDEMVIGCPTRDEIVPRFVEFCEGCILVGHNVGFDISFINENCRQLGIDVDYTTVDTMGLSRAFFPRQAKHNLDALCKTLGVVNEHHHRAVDDAECTAKIFLKFMPMMEQEQADDLTKVNALGASNPEIVKHLRTHHVIILAKNTIGRVNLYTLVSKSHLDYFSRFPRIPKSELMKYREGLIIGSACCAGELYGAVVEDRDDQEIAKIVNFYDYLEIQPVANNHFMVESERYETINSDDDIREVNKRIVRLGEQYGKPVVATCDAHFLNPDDEIYRTVIMAGKGMNEETPAPLFVRTTAEMLKEFDYLGAAKAKEVVIDNTRDILKRCDSISPVRPDKCPPVIEDSDGILTRICYDKAHEIYGENLPAIVEERLERELNSIIKNGFAVMYIIAQKLVWKSVEDGYLVGSRGSVGSSFVAFASGITEVNSLSPHYVCPKCKYSDFDSEDVLKYGGNSGCDMPDKKCPKCGHMMNKDGFDIPFETFLGFKGDKEPDIDLNFSGEYQSKAHKYTEVIFGYGQTFRAGTIAGLADKTAYGFVKKYYDGIGAAKRRCEIDRITQGCIGIRRGTGQHPGGIIVLPVGEDINSFTPVQHPANDMTTATITTHYDYHSIDHNLLKLDILGHDDPTMIRFLQDCTGLDPKTVPLDDKNVMKLFMNTESLNITPDQIGGTKLGCLGLPEFGTDFAMQMVIDASPSSLSHLIRISGLSHGTDVWLGNAQTLIQEGKATIDTCICCRDDIMIYLIQKGMDKSLSFKTMESVRKGKGLTPDMENAMIEAGVPDWYIWSCKKIKYMFPKAHAAAYVMMAWRIAYFKVYVPQAFYAAWFSIRAKALSYEHMFQGEGTLHMWMNTYRSKGDAMTNAEQNELAAMRLAEEMYERGIEVMPIDIFKAASRSFQVFGDKIMPSLVSIDGLGEKAADQIVEAAKDGPFISRDDFRQRTKCPQAVVEKMANMGLLGDIPESNQISIFDFMKG